jgi:hypothetical protein
VDIANESFQRESALSNYLQEWDWNNAVSRTVSVV